MLSLATLIKTSPNNFTFVVNKYWFKTYNVAKEKQISYFTYDFKDNDRRIFSVKQREVGCICHSVRWFLIWNSHSDITSGTLGIVFFEMTIHFFLPFCHLQNITVYLFHLFFTFNCDCIKNFFSQKHMLSFQKWITVWFFLLIYRQLNIQIDDLIIF